ncbi:MAG: GspE/PulE family protein [Bacteroidia bacterium]
MNINPQHISSISPQQAWFYRIVPKDVGTNEMIFYTDNEGLSGIQKDELEFVLGCKIGIQQIDKNKVEEFLTKFYPRVNEEETLSKNVVNILPDSEKFLPFLISEAKLLNSSDIHIEVYYEKARIRFRIDGLMLERYLLDKEKYPALVNKVKIMSNLDIAEKRLPQDGRIIFQDETSKVDIRVSVLPTLYGEKIVLRLLGTNAAHIDINQLGFGTEDIARYKKGIQKPHGIVLISGPTGSGKTTTLYATLNLLNNNTRNIVTIEDPIEYTLEGVNQVQVKENIGLTFAAGLRTFLRQDPDIIMLGEIRDQETAAMAIRASLTGHLVLSTIHTNSAWSTFTRLSDMGIAPYLIAETVNISVAQRLIRLLCHQCKKEVETEKESNDALPADKRLNTHFVPIGCPYCNFTGYKGRQALYELILVDSTIADLIKKREADISGYYSSLKINTLQDNAYRVYAKGETSLTEIYPILIS